MLKTRLTALLILIAGLGIGYFDYISQTDETSGAYRPFKLGLDLSGGAHLVYSADVSSIPPQETKEAMATLRDVIERRVNLFGVAEPIVQTERPSAFAGEEEEGHYRLIVELPGVTDVKQAVETIGQTPVLEFMTRKEDADTESYQQALDAYYAAQEERKEAQIDPDVVTTVYQPTELTGRFLSKASVQFDQTTGEPYVSVTFNSEGKELFAQLTRQNVGKPIAIFLDRHLGNIEPITEPIVQEEIPGGQAQITGNFTPEEAKTLVGRLNSGALPVDKLELISTQSIGPTLGAEATKAGVAAGVWGLGLVALFLIFWYRLPGLLATAALGIYLAIMLALFKLIPVTLTAAGIAGFVLSIGMAVDANILIFERTKEELRRGEKVRDAVAQGFQRAWLSIRDGNISSIITAVILFWFGTSLVEGFALTFGLGILISMFSAIVVTRTFLLAFATEKKEGAMKKAFNSGIR